MIDELRGKRYESYLVTHTSFPVFSSSHYLSLFSPFHVKLGLNGTLVETKMFTFIVECTHFIFKKCPVPFRPTTVQARASAKF